MLGINVTVSNSRLTISEEMARIYNALSSARGTEWRLLFAGHMTKVIAFSFLNSLYYLASALSGVWIAVAGDIQRGRARWVEQKVNSRIAWDCFLFSICLLLKGVFAGTAHVHPQIILPTVDQKFQAWLGNPSPEEQARLQALLQTQEAQEWLGNPSPEGLAQLHHNRELQTRFREGLSDLSQEGRRARLQELLDIQREQERAGNPALEEPAQARQNAEAQGLPGDELPLAGASGRGAQPPPPLAHHPNPDTRPIDQRLDELLGNAARCEELRLLLYTQEAQERLQTSDPFYLDLLVQDLAAQERLKEGLSNEIPSAALEGPDALRQLWPEHIIPGELDQRHPAPEPPQPDPEPHREEPGLPFDPRRTVRAGAPGYEEWKKVSLCSWLRLIIGELRADRRTALSEAEEISSDLFTAAGMSFERWEREIYPLPLDRLMSLATRMLILINNPPWAAPPPGWREELQRRVDSAPPEYAQQRDRVNDAHERGAYAARFARWADRLQGIINNHEWATCLKQHPDDQNITEKYRVFVTAWGNLFNDHSASSPCPNNELANSVDRTLSRAGIRLEASRTRLEAAAQSLEEVPQQCVSQMEVVQKAIAEARVAEATPDECNPHLGNDVAKRIADEILRMRESELSQQLERFQSWLRESESLRSELERLKEVAERWLGIKQYFDQEGLDANANYNFEFVPLEAAAIGG